MGHHLSDYGTVLDQLAFYINILEGDAIVVDFVDVALHSTLVAFVVVDFTLVLFARVLKAVFCDEALLLAKSKYLIYESSLAAETVGVAIKDFLGREFYGLISLHADAILNSREGSKGVRR